MEAIEKLRDDSNYYGAYGKQYLSNSDIGSLLTNPREYGVSTPDNANFAKGKLFHQLIKILLKQVEKISLYLLKRLTKSRVL